MATDTMPCAYCGDVHPWPGLDHWPNWIVACCWNCYMRHNTKGEELRWREAMLASA